MIYSYIRPIPCPSQVLFHADFSNSTGIQVARPLAPSPGRLEAARFAPPFGEGQATSGGFHEPPADRQPDAGSADRAGDEKIEGLPLHVQRSIPGIDALDNQLNSEGSKTRRREANLDQVAKDLLSLGGIGNDGCKRKRACLLDSRSCSVRRNGSRQRVNCAVFSKSDLRCEETSHRANPAFRLLLFELLRWSGSPTRENPTGTRSATSGKEHGC